MSPVILSKHNLSQVEKHLSNVLHQFSWLNNENVKKMVQAKKQFKEKGSPFASAGRPNYVARMVSRQMYAKVLGHVAPLYRAAVRAKQDPDSAKKLASLNDRLATLIADIRENGKLYPPSAFSTLNLIPDYDSKSGRKLDFIPIQYLMGVDPDDILSPTPPPVHPEGLLMRITKAMPYLTGPEHLFLSSKILS